MTMLTIGQEFISNADIQSSFPTLPVQIKATSLYPYQLTIGGLGIDKLASGASTVITVTNHADLCRSITDTSQIARMQKVDVMLTLEDITTDLNAVGESTGNDSTGVGGGSLGDSAASEPAIDAAATPIQPTTKKKGG